MAYHANLDRLRAERSLDAAQAASVPHLTREGRTSWYRHVSKRTARRAVARTVTSEGGSAPMFTVNGQSVGKGGLARWLAATFGMPLAMAPPQPVATSQGETHP